MLQGLRFAAHIQRASLGSCDRIDGKSRVPHDDGGKAPASQSLTMLTCVISID